jgi:hypothetical protein
MLDVTPLVPRIGVRPEPARDLVMVDDGSGVVAGALVIRNPGGNANRLLPWDHVASVDERAVLVDQPRSPRDSTAVDLSLIVRIHRDLLGRRIVDRDGSGSGKPATPGSRWLRAASSRRSRMLAGRSGRGCLAATTALERQGDPVAACGSGERRRPAAVAPVRHPRRVVERVRSPRSRRMQEGTASRIRTLGNPCPMILQPGIHGLALQRQHPEHALVNAPQRLAPDEPLERLDAERELAERE